MVHMIGMVGMVGMVGMDDIHRGTGVLTCLLTITRGCVGSV